METTLYQVAKTGRMKVMKLSAVGNQLVTEWYTSLDGVDGKKQEVIDIIHGVNQGKANETSDAEQCILELERKVKEKKDDGYCESIEEAKEKSQETADIHSLLPKEFSPCKPISKLKGKQDPYDGTWLAERKHNGSCILLHNTGESKHIYTRTVLEITDIVSCVPEAVEALDKVPDGSLFIAEIVATESDGTQTPNLLRAVTHDKTTPEKALDRYNKMVADGVTFSIYVFEVFFYKGDNVTELQFTDRRKITEEIYGERDIKVFTEQMAYDAAKLEWEGFVLRQPEDTIEYSMNGKPRRKGSYKFKFVYETDCFIWGLEQGSGKNKERFGGYLLGQYDEEGNFIKCGKSGTGFFKDAEVEEVTQRFFDLGYALDTVVELNPSDWVPVEVQYQTRQPKNDKGEVCFEFPQPVRLREDKPVSECLLEDYALVK
jgi:ATP-dependent DNA ligase